MEGSIGGDIVWIGQAIAALGALLYIAKLAYEGMLGGNLFTLKTFRPFALALVLALYPQFMLVIDGINGSQSRLRSCHHHR